MIDLDFKRPYIIAEIGGNHEGDFDYAKKLLIEAAEAGADAAKFQTYYPDKIVSKVEDKNRHNHFSKFVLSIENYKELASIAHDNGISFMSSIWDRDSLFELDPFINIHKIGSGDLTNFPLIEEIISTDKPLIISTAMATMDEIHETVNFIKKINPSYICKSKLAILQCVAMYGDLKDEYANLNVISSLRKDFKNLTIGYSDHTKGIYAANIAVALGAKILEIHFTDDKNRDFRDHKLSATKKDIIELKENISKTLKLLGSNVKLPEVKIETNERIREFRRACYFKEDVKKGEVITYESLTTLRPCEGIDARDFYKLIGKRMNVNKKAFEAIYWDDIK